MILMLVLDILVGAEQGTSKGEVFRKLQGRAGAPAGQEHKRETQSWLFTEVGTETSKTIPMLRRGRFTPL